MDNNKGIRPLFGEGDIRHSVGTVEERWRKEMNRRRRLMAKILLPLLVLLLACWGYFAWKNRYFPFKSKPRPFTPQIIEDEPMSLGPKPQTALGYDEAKLRIKVILPVLAECPQAWLEIFYEATDTKPSEISIQIWSSDNITADELALMGSADKLGIFVNGSPDLEYMNENGVLIKNNFLDDKAASKCDPVALSAIINHYYSKIYNNPKPLLDMKKIQEEKKRKLEEAKKDALPEILTEEQAGKDKNPAEQIKLDYDSIILRLPGMKVDSDK